MQFAPEPGWLNDQATPTALWHCVQGVSEADAGLKCLLGTVWQELQLALAPGCENVHDLPGCLWQVEQAGRLPETGAKSGSRCARGG